MPLILMKIISQNHYSLVFVLVIITVSSFILNINSNYLNGATQVISSDSQATTETERTTLDSSRNRGISSLQPFQQPRILFIVGNRYSLSENYDKPFLYFMNSTLNYNVTIHDDDNSYAYDDYDAIVISRTIGESGTVDSLTNASIPILTMESWNYDVFGLGNDRNYDASHNHISLLDTSHYITQGYSLGYQEIYQTSTWIEYLENYNQIKEEVEIVSLALRRSSNTEERTLVVLDKGKKDWDLSLAPERRAFWGAVRGDILNDDGWTLWNNTLHWILYDDVPGNASICINVKDLDGRSVANARLNLTESLNYKLSWSQNTTEDGYITFTKIPFGYYNITAEFEDSINDTLTFIEIAGERTYETEPYFEFTVQVPEYVDNSPPVIENIHFEPISGNFSSNIYDESSLSTVNLSLTVKNITDAMVMRDESFKMVTGTGNYYFNDTGLEGLPSTGISVTYNITAIDIAGNTKISPNQFFTLGDSIAPTIHEYNVTDFENGTLRFYANVTDDESLVSEVTLKINNNFLDMQLSTSGFWICTTNAYYGITLNYTIFSAKDSVGNENNTPNPSFSLVTPNDTVEPLIWGVTDTFSTHENGYVEFNAFIKDWNDYQSRVNFSDVQIHFSINGDNTTDIMDASGEETFSYKFTFNYNDSVYYRITASDLAGNINSGFEHGPFKIDDNAMPQVTFEAIEYGNGTVEFNATVIDWPNNQTTVSLHYTQDYFGTWDSLSMMNITQNFFDYRIHDFDYNRYDVWYYVTANDAALNLFEPSPDQYLRIQLTDKVSPEVTFTIENSTVIDGEIAIDAWAIDSYGRTYYMNNTFYINFTTPVGNLNFEMDFDVLNYYTFSQSFKYGERIDILVYVMDDAGNLGKINKTIIIEDHAPPKIKVWGVNEYQNGTVTIWTEIEEGPNGSGLPEENSSIIIEYVFISLYKQNMVWNGSKNFFTYTVSGFEPENAFTYRINATDKCNNSYTTEWIQKTIVDQTPPTYTSFGYSETLVNHSTSQLNFWIDATDPFGSIEHVNLSFYHFNGSNWLNKTAEMQYSGSSYVHSIQIACNRTFNYSIYVSDKALNAIEVSNTSLRTYWGPVIIETNVEHISEKELIVWANVSDWGSGIAEVLLEYEFISSGRSSARASATKDQFEAISMDYNGTVYLTHLTFDMSGTFTWKIIVRDNLNKFNVEKASTQPYFFNLPAQTFEWMDLVPLLITVGIIPALLVTFVFMARKRRQHQILIKKRKLKEIIDRSSDIFSLRALICRNQFGLAFYTENFIESGQDEDMIAGITSAMSRMVTDIAQREIKSGEFDVLEREGFNILSYHGQYTTTSIISEEKLSSFMKMKMSLLTNQIESKFSQEELEGLMTRELREKTKKLVYEILPVGLLQPLTVDFKLFKHKKKLLQKNERKWFKYVTEVPSFVDAQPVFYASTFISSLTVHGIPLVKAFCLLENCYNLDVIRNLTEAERTLLVSGSSSSRSGVLVTE
ncbi:MAG: hypothetical protein ACFFCQ_00130 [Promethearchaeota archaeon]